MEWFLKAANQGYADAECRIGDFYHNGDGIPRDYAKAMEWYIKAADHAQCTIGVLHYHGHGVSAGLFQGDGMVSQGRESGTCFYRYYSQRSVRHWFIYQGIGVARDYAKVMEGV